MSTTPTTTPPAWLEAAAKLDAIAADRVPLGPTRLVPASQVDADGLAGEETPARLPAAPVALPNAVAEAREEVDLGWHGYDAGALLPGTLVLSVLTAGALLELRRLVPPSMVVEVVYAPLAALWAGQVIRLAYRLLAYRYRLTNRRLLRERGRLYPPEEPLDLATVARVEVSQPLFDRLLGVGTVNVVPEEASGRPAVELPGVRRPQVLAAAVEQAAQAAREGNMTVVRLKLTADVRQ
jgi:hypothetical protein